MNNRYQFRLASLFEDGTLYFEAERRVEMGDPLESLVIARAKLRDRYPADEA